MKRLPLFLLVFCSLLPLSACGEIKFEGAKSVE